jgi:putative ABC transport system substrate-binding protein
VSPLVAEAQQSAKVPRIGWLRIASPTPAVSHLMEAFRQGLRELGYVEGQNIAVEYRFAEGRPERLPEFAAQLVALKVDIIVTPNPAGTQAAKEATSTIPIVFMGVTDPAGSGLVASLARPGGNVTGLTASASPVIYAKCVELLKETVPKASRMAGLRNPTNPDAAQMSREAGGAARALGVQLQVLDVRVPNELDSGFARMTRDRVGALLILADTMFTLYREQLAVLAIKSRLPTVSGARELAQAGLLMAYGRSLPYEFRRAATYVDKILKGTKPADLPVEQPTKFELVPFQLFSCAGVVTNG